MKNRSLFYIFLISFVFFGCEKQKFFSLENFASQKPQSDKTTFEINKTFLIQGTSQIFKQEELEQNDSSLFFQIRKPDGTMASELLKDEIEFFENGIPILNFNLKKNSTESKQVADIVFVVDVTGSMKKTIEAAKIRLIDFIRNSRLRGYHTRMCLITFGDYTVSRCDRFYDNNPNDPNTLGDVEHLISEITKLKALTGGSDPGGYDLDENPMRALIDATGAPWLNNDQRFAILVTDAGFLYSPGNTGQVGSLAPRYDEVKKSLASSQMKIFAATPSFAGYNLTFKGSPGVVELSNGEWFKYADLVSGKINLDTILNRILNVIDTTFVADYVVEDQPNLNPSLPLQQRIVSSQLKNEMLGEIIHLNLKSNLPDGRKEYQKDFKLSERGLDKSSLEAFVNGVQVFDYTIDENNQLTFKTAPEKNARIEIRYFFSDPKDGLVVTPILLPLSASEESIELFLNGIPAQKSDFRIELNADKSKYFVLTDSIFSLNDPFHILENRKLDIQIKTKISDLDHTK